MKNLKTILYSVLCLSLAGLIGCGGTGSGGSSNEKRDPLAPAEAKEWVDATAYNDAEVLDAYLQPIWYTHEVYDDTAVFVGPESSASLLYAPSGSITVRNYDNSITYTEGVDYTVSGKTVTRIATGNLPYWPVDEYYLTTPVSGVSIGVSASKCEFDFDEPRYLVYDDYGRLTPKHIRISYTTDEVWEGKVPADPNGATDNLIDKLKNDKSAKLMFYGDSITVGCSASGTSYGGNVNPHLPAYFDLVSTWLEKKYDADITVLNEAQGGWQVSNGFANFNTKILQKATEIDLLVLAFGMNDMSTNLDTYRAMTQEMANRYLAANPNGTVLLVSTMLPNTQSTWVGNQRYFEDELYKIANDNDNIAVAPVTSVFTEYENMGKRTRDWLANNINHPNDFGVRTYAQVILKSLVGNDYSREIYL